MTDFVAEVGDLAVRLVVLGFSMGSDHWLLEELYRSPNAKIAELRGTLSDFWRWSSNQCCQTAKVLRDSGERELELGSARPSQPQTAKPQNALEMGKQHLDALSIAA